MLKEILVGEEVQVKVGDNLFNSKKKIASLLINSWSLQSIVFTTWRSFDRSSGSIDTIFAKAEN